VFIPNQFYFIYDYNLEMGPDTHPATQLEEKKIQMVWVNPKHWRTFGRGFNPNNQSKIVSNVPKQELWPSPKNSVLH